MNIWFALILLFSGVAGASEDEFIYFSTQEQRRFWVFTHYKTYILGKQAGLLATVTHNSKEAENVRNFTPLEPQPTFTYEWATSMWLEDQARKLQGYGCPAISLVTPVGGRYYGVVWFEATAEKAYPYTQHLAVKPGFLIPSTLPARAVLADLSGINPEVLRVYRMGELETKAHAVVEAAFEAANELAYKDLLARLNVPCAESFAR